MGGSVVSIPGEKSYAISDANRVSNPTLLLLGDNLNPLTDFDRFLNGLAGHRAEEMQVDNARCPSKFSDVIWCAGDLKACGQDMHHDKTRLVNAVAKLVFIVGNPSRL